MIKERFKKILFGGVALSTLSLASISPAFAAVSNTTGDGDTGAISHGHVTLESDSETEDPTGPIVDPDPEDPDGGSTGNTSALRIDWVTPLEFGMQTLSSESKTYTTESINPNVQVSDLRGTGEGWALQVAASAFKDGTKELKGATIKFPAGTLKTTTGNISEPPTAYGVTLNTGDSSSGQTIMEAIEGAGMGTWADSFDASKVELYVPAGNYAGDYEATLTWTLSKAPQ